MFKILNTRPAGQNKELSQLLAQAGFEPIEIPLVDILPLEEGLRKILRLPPSGYTGIFISSPNGLRQMQAGLDDDFEKWMQKPFYVVGGKTKTMVEKLGGKVAFFPERASVAGFLQEYPLESMGSGSKGGMVFAQRWLHPCSASTRLEPDLFKKCGVTIDNVPVYRPDLPSEAAAKLIHECAHASGAIFCSGSAVENFFKAAPDQAAKLGRSKFLAISIGASTSDVLRAKGVEKIFESLTSDSEGLVDALRSAIGGYETQVLKKKLEINP